MKIQQISEIRDAIFSEISKVIVGQKEVIEELIIALFAQGHVLIIGVPGLAKTLLVKTLAKILDLKFSRIQFTPDLMPSDIIGTDILEEDPETGKRRFKFVPGPIFANIILADEINRTPPKTQSALLEAMQELHVTVGGKTYPLNPPFFVMATQNPIEQEGTYPLPEAQLDRFMFSINMDYPSRQEEEEIVLKTTTGELPEPQKILTKEEILEIQKFVREAPVPDHIIKLAVNLVRETRPNPNNSLPIIKKYVSYGAGPRASQFLVLGAKTKALLEGRPTPREDDIIRVILPVLRHRIITNFRAEAENIQKEEIISEITKKILKKSL